MGKQINIKANKVSATLLYAFFVSFCLLFLNASSQFSFSESSKSHHHNAKVSAQNDVDFSLFDVCEEDSDNEEEDADDSKILANTRVLLPSKAYAAVKLKNTSSSPHFSCSKRYLAFSILRI